MASEISAIIGAAVGGLIGFASAFGIYILQRRDAKDAAKRTAQALLALVLRELEECKAGLEMCETASEAGSTGYVVKPSAVPSRIWDECRTKLAHTAWLGPKFSETFWRLVRVHDSLGVARVTLAQPEPTDEGRAQLSGCLSAVDSALPALRELHPEIFPSDE